MTLFELLLFGFAYGAPVFLAGRIIQLFILKPYQFKWATVLLTLLITQILSFGLMMLFWRFWPLSIVIMFKVIVLPAILSEGLVLLFNYLYLTKYSKKWA